jgi:MOSC domain-containing protein YiiM
MNQGTLLSIYIAGEAAGPMTSLPSVRVVPGRGLETDRYARGEGTFSKVAGGGREVTLIASEMIELYARDNGRTLDPGETRRNLVTRGVSLNDLVGKIFRVGDVRLKGVRLAEPCEHLERLTHAGVKKGLVHRGGLRADVLDAGVLRVGDDIREVVAELVDRA